MTSRLAQLEAQILERKAELDVEMRYTPRKWRIYRCMRWKEFLANIAPLVAEREALLRPAYVAPVWRRRQIRAAQIDTPERQHERARLNRGAP